MYDPQNPWGSSPTPDRPDALRYSHAHSNGVSGRLIAAGVLVAIALGVVWLASG